MALVENLVSISRIERGTLTVKEDNIKWIENVRSIVLEMMVQAKDKNINLHFDEADGVEIELNADKFRINEVLSNLLSNAINYTDPGGEVAVWIEKNDTEIVTHIKDTGEGIPQDAISHLFTKFFRVSGKLEQGSKGTGLGLYIAKSIIEMHQGKIWVESEFGKGSTFSFSLPLKKLQ